MYLNGTVSTVFDFKVLDTDKDNNYSEITVDLSKLGTYDVTLNSENGLSKNVKLTIQATIPILRSYSPNNGDHLYTSNEEEYNWITGLNGMQKVLLSRVSFQIINTL